MTRREQVCEATARHRKRRKRGFFWRPILVTKAQLDQLEERGYLNPGDRGTRADECEAIETFLAESLAKSQIVSERLRPGPTKVLLARSELELDRDLLSHRAKGP
jgi:hypothetical protein